MTTTYQLALCTRRSGRSREKKNIWHYSRSGIETAKSCFNLKILSSNSVRLCLKVKLWTWIKTVKSVSFGTFPTTILTSTKVPKVVKQDNSTLQLWSISKNKIKWQFHWNSQNPLNSNRLFVMWLFQRWSRNYTWTILYFKHFQIFNSMLRLPWTFRRSFQTKKKLSKKKRSCKVTFPTVRKIFHSG